MKDGRKRPRSSNWSHEETMLLAELKKEAFLNKEEGGLVWKQIAQKIAIVFPDKTRSDDQCRRRWDTLRKDYNHIEEYCVETGQNHWELDEEELSSMKLDTAYRRDWYDIVKQVCSQRKRKERGYRDLIAVKQSKRSDISSHSAVFPELTPGRDTLFVTPPTSTSEPVTTRRDTHHEQFTAINAQICTRSSLESIEKLSIEEENLRLKRENDALILELAQMRQRVELTEQVQTAQGGTGSELIMARSRSLSPECSSHGQQHLGAMNSAEGMPGSGHFATFTCFSPPISVPAMGFRDQVDFPVGCSKPWLEPGLSTSVASRTTSRNSGLRVSGWTISGQIIDSIGKVLIEELGSNWDAHCVSKRSRLLQRPWRVLKLFVWACLHFFFSLKRIREKNQRICRSSLRFTHERILGNEDIAGNNVLSAAFDPPDSMDNGLVPCEGLNDIGLFQLNTGWPAQPTFPRRVPRRYKIIELCTLIQLTLIRVTFMGKEKKISFGEIFKETLQLLSSFDPIVPGSTTTSSDIEYVSCPGPEANSELAALHPGMFLLPVQMFPQDDEEIHEPLRCTATQMHLDELQANQWGEGTSHHEQIRLWEGL